MSKKIILALFIFAFVILILPKNTYALEANVKTAIDNLDFDRKSKNEINLYFSNTGVNEVSRYSILKRDKSSKDFKEIKSISARDVKTSNLSYTDKISVSGYVRYEYRVDAYLKNGKVLKGKSIYASNVLICIDPGHFQTKSL